MANGLAHATSPYLLQHKDNPVDWWQWGPAAFAEAQRRDVPVLLSIGYAACHWCHVMAHESFEDPATAAVMNEHFVNVKVDREERPDVDAVYMAATQALTGHGGWPMTVFLTPAGRPFYTGTYFPPSPSRGMPSFGQVLAAIEQTWREQRGEVEGAGERICQALAQRSFPAGEHPPTAQTLAAAVAALAADEDRRHGGFGSAPKFPPSMDLEFLLRHAARLRLEGDVEAAAQALDLAGRTLHAMARSGMYDQLAGGFARYAVDAGWVVPHFEKMLYDNALLARVYLHWWRLTGEPTGARIALETCDWMLAELRTAGGGLASSLDADTPVRDADGSVHGVEGYTYVWTPGRLAQVLGEGDGAWAADLLRVTPEGTFEHGASTLQLARDVWTDDEQAARWRAARGRLLTQRAGRPQPGRDDKVVAAWNGLAIAALAETGALLDRPELIAAAERIADLLVSVHLVAEAPSAGPTGPTGPAEPAAQGKAGPRARLRRVSRDGVVGAPAGVLEDYGDVAEGLIALHAVTGEPAWLELTAGLLDTVLDRFADGNGGFFDTPSDGTDAALAAVRRPQDPTDNAYPGGWSAATGAGLHAVALRGTAPGLVVSVGEPDAPGVPLLAGRPLPPGGVAAYVCRGFVCDAPVTGQDELAALVAARPFSP